MRYVLPILLLLPVALAQEAPKPGTARAVRGTVRATLERQGTFVPAEAAELKLDLQRYRGELRIAEVLPHGSFVNEGDLVLHLDTRAVDEQIEREKMALEQAALALRQAEESARDAAEAAALGLERAEMEAARAAQKLRGYREHEKAFNDENERLSVQARRYRLEDQKDELDQLEKMYSEDELVDATEEIVLKRARRNYARAVASFELSEKRRKYNKKWYEPWREEDLERAAREKRSALERLRRKQQREAAKREADLARKRYDLEKQRENLARLRKDRAQFEVRAPRSGRLLHGPARAAPWPSRLKKDAALKNRAVFACVARPKRFRIVTSVAETDVLKLKPNTAVEAIPTAAPDRVLTGALGVDDLPAKGGAFPAVVRLPDRDELALRPGFTCKLRIILEEERDAVVVPKAAVTKRDGKSFVRAAKTAGGPFEEREVLTGLTDGKRIAIREGLAEGEFVALGEK